MSLEFTKLFTGLRISSHGAFAMTSRRTKQKVGKVHQLVHMTAVVLLKDS